MSTAVTREYRPMTAHICFRLLWNSSMQLATRVSITDTQEVRAAKPSIRKKAAPTRRPTRPMDWNTLGRETKVRLGPKVIPSVPKKT